MRIQSVSILTTAMSFSRHPQSHSHHEQRWQSKRYNKIAGDMRDMCLAKLNHRLIFRGTNFDFEQERI